MGYEDVFSQILFMKSSPILFQGLECLLLIDHVKILLVKYGI